MQIATSKLQSEKLTSPTRRVAEVDRRGRAGGGKSTPVRHPFTLLSLLVCCLLPLHASAEPIPVRSVFLTLLEEVEVPAREAGLLESIGVEEGHSVGEGDTLGELESATTKLARARAELELSKAKREATNDLKIKLADTTLQIARIELERAKKTNERLPGSISPSQIDSLRLQVDQAELEVEQAQFDLATAQMTVALRENDVKVAEEALRRRRITAPIDGFVVEVRREKGEWVEAGEPLLRLARMNRLRAEGLLDSQLTQGNLLGRRVRLTVELHGSEVEFTGKVSFVSPEVEPVNGHVRVWAVIENHEFRLRPGMKATMVIGDR